MTPQTSSHTISAHSPASAITTTTDGRELTLSRYTQPEPEQRLLLEQLRLTLPSQPPPKITAAQVPMQAPALAL